MIKEMYQKHCPCAGLTFLACMGAALTVIPWTKAVRRLNVLVEFSIFWKARLFLVLIGAFWLVCLLSK